VIVYRRYFNSALAESGDERINFFLQNNGFTQIERISAAVQVFKREKSSDGQNRFCSSPLNQRLKVATNSCHGTNAICDFRRPA
jgi:hypothetical protein